MERNTETRILNWGQTSRLCEADWAMIKEEFVTKSDFRRENCAKHHYEKKTTELKREIHNKDEQYESLCKLKDSMEAQLQGYQEANITLTHCDETLTMFTIHYTLTHCDGTFNFLYI